MKAIKVMPDYGCHPLWHHGNTEVGDINPSILPISPSLIARLEKWAAEYDATLNHDYPPDSSFTSKEEKERFVARGFELAKLLKTELNNIAVIYYDIDQNREHSI